MAQEKHGVQIELEVEAKNLNTTLREAQAEVKALSTQFTNYSKAAKLDPDNLNNYTTALSRLGDKQKAQVTIVESLKGKLSNLSTQLSSQKTLVGDLESKVSSSKTAYQQLNSAYDDNAKKLQEANTALDDCIMKETKAQMAVDKAKASVEKMTEKYGAEATQTKSATTKLQNRTTELENAQKATEEALKAVDSFTDEEKKEADALSKAKNELAYNETELVNAKTKQGDLEHEIDKTNTQLENEKSKLAKTEAELKSYDEETESASEKSEAFQVALGNLISQGIQKALSGLKDLAQNVLETGSAFEDAQAGLAAVLQVSTDSQTVKDLSNAFQDLASSSTSSATEITTYATTLANAGYSAEEIVQAIEPINDLAVGTGESFDSMATIVVDGLAAFGQSASEATNFANILAKSAISSNTNVEQMGEAFKYAGSVAGQFGYDVEDVGVALGAMANQGVKASSAGTALRTIITRLATNTGGARKAIEELGVSFYDENSKARDLGDVLSDLREATQGMGDEELATLEKTVAGQRGMTGLAAILSTTDEKWAELTSEVNNYNGTIEGMADTKLDTYSGQVQLLKNSWEKVATELFKEVEPNLLEIVKTLKKVCESEVFKDSLKTAVKGLVSIFEGLTNAISLIGPNTVKAVSGITAIVAGIKGLKTGSTIVSNMQSWFKQLGNTASTTGTQVGQSTSSFGILNSALSTLAGKTGLSTTQLGLLGAGATVAAALIADATLSINDANQAYINALGSANGFTDAMRENCEEISTLKNSFTELKATSEENVATVEAQYSQYEMLAQEYDKLIDSNGQVKQGYEDEANTIMTTLAEALGMEKADLQEIVNQHGNMTSAIAQEMEMKKANALLTSYEDQYTTAVQNSGQALQDKLTAEQQFTEQSTLTEEKLQALKLATAQYNAEMKINGTAQQETINAMQNAANEYEISMTALEQLASAVETADSTYNDYQNTIANYEGASSAIVSGDATKISETLDNLTNDWKNATNSTRAQLEQQVTDAKTNLNALKTAYSNGEQGITEEMVNQAQSRYDRAQAELDKSTEMYGEKGNESGTEYVQKTIKAIEAKEDEAYNAGKKTSSKAKSGAESVDSSSSGSYFGQGFVNGVKSKNGDAYSAGQTLATHAKSGVNGTLQINSPSRVMMETGKYVVAGLTKGIEKNIPQVDSASIDLANAVRDTVGNGLNATSSTTNNSYSYSSTPNITIVQRDGENAEDLARRVSEIISNDIDRRGKVWA